MQGCTDVGTLHHELLYCRKNDEVGLKLLECVQQYNPGLQADGVLRLEHGHVDDDLSLPTTLLIGTILSILWKERQAAQTIRAYKVRAELEQSINLLRTTRFKQTTAVLRDMSRFMFH